jgi:hypothetical protein
VGTGLFPFIIGEILAEEAWNPAHSIRLVNNCFFPLYPEVVLFKIVLYTLLKDNE